MIWQRRASRPSRRRNSPSNSISTQRRFEKTSATSASLVCAVWVTSSMIYANISQKSSALIGRIAWASSEPGGWERRWLTTTASRNQISRSEEHTSELQSHSDLVCRLLLEKKKQR